MYLDNLLLCSLVVVSFLFHLFLLSKMCIRIRYFVFILAFCWLLGRSFAEDVLRWVKQPSKSSTLASLPTTLSIDVTLTHNAQVNCGAFPLGTTPTIEQLRWASNRAFKRCTGAVACTLTIDGLKVKSYYDIYCMGKTVQYTTAMSTVLRLQTASFGFTSNPVIGGGPYAAAITMKATLNADCMLYCAALKEDENATDSDAIILSSRVGRASCVHNSLCRVKIGGLSPVTAYSVYCVGRTSDLLYTPMSNPIPILTDEIAFLKLPVFSQFTSASSVDFNLTLNTLAVAYCAALPHTSGDLPKNAWYQVTTGSPRGQRVCFANESCVVSIQDLAPDTDYDVSCVAATQGADSTDQKSDVTSRVSIHSPAVTLSDFIVTENLRSIIIETTVNRPAVVVCALYAQFAVPPTTPADLNSAASTVPRAHKFCESNQPCVISVLDLQARQHFDAYCGAITHSGFMSAIYGSVSVSTGALSAKPRKLVALSVTGGYTPGQRLDHSQIPLQHFPSTMFMQPPSMASSFFSISAAAASSSTSRQSHRRVMMLTVFASCFMTVAAAVAVAFYHVQKAGGWPRFGFKPNNGVGGGGGGGGGGVGKGPNNSTKMYSDRTVVTGEFV